MSNKAETGRIISRSMYGIIITTALLTTLEHAHMSAWGAVLAIVGSLFSVSIAEAYTESVGAHIEQGKKLPKTERRSIWKESLYVFGGSTIPVLAFVGAGFYIWSLETAFLIAKVSAMVLLFEYGYLLGRRSGRTKGASLRVGALNVLLALAIIAFKELIHV